MAQYNGTIDLISGVRPKNGGDFPLVNAKDIQVKEDGTRLDSDLNDLHKAVDNAGKVKSVNGKAPDGSGAVTLEMGDIDGLTEAIAGAGSVKTVAGVAPDSAGNVTLGAADLGAATAEEVGKLKNDLVDLDSRLSESIVEISDDLTKPFTFQILEIYDESLKYPSNAKGWCGAGTKTINTNSVVKTVTCIPSDTTIYIGILHVSGGTVSDFRIVGSYSNLVIGVKNVIPVEIPVRMGDILLVKNVRFVNGTEPAYYWAKDYSGDRTKDDPTAGQEMTTYNLFAPFGYSNNIDEAYDFNFGINDLYPGTTDAVDSLKDELVAKYDFWSGDRYNNNNRGWTAANNVQKNVRGHISEFTVVSHSRSLSTFGGIISVVKVTLDDIDTIVSIEDVGDYQSTGNLKKQTFQCDIDIEPNQVLLFRGIGFADSATPPFSVSPVYFTVDLVAGETLGKYSMEAPIAYEVIFVGEIIRRVNENARKIAALEQTRIDAKTKFAAFGDSITSADVSNIGALLPEKLGIRLVANFAEGNATASDYSEGGVNTTTISLDTQPDQAIATNVLSNQVRRMLAHTTPSGNQISWVHPIDGNFSIDTSYGTGLGNVNDSPDIIYIACGTNDTKRQSVMVVDDTDDVFSQSYAQLTRITLCSALRWAIETLQCAYPNAQIFVCSPLQTKRGWNNTSGLNTRYTWVAREIIRKTCAFCSVRFIDSYAESGFSNLIAQTVNDGIHPTGVWRDNIVDYLANEIENRYIKRYKISTI